MEYDVSSWQWTSCRCGREKALIVDEQLAELQEQAEKSNAAQGIYCDCGALIGVVYPPCHQTKIDNFDRAIHDPTGLTWMEIYKHGQ